MELIEVYLAFAEQTCFALWTPVPETFVKMPRNLFLDICWWHYVGQKLLFR